MNAIKLLVSLMSVFVLAAFASSAASAQFADITSVTVNGIEAFNTGTQIAGVYAGETVPVRVIFYANQSVTDVRINARLEGASGFSEVTERFTVKAGSTNSRLLNIQLPSDIDPSEAQVLVISLERDASSGGDTVGDSARISFEVLRDAYSLQILSADSPDSVKAGKTLPLDIVLKNNGGNDAEDSYVKAQILQLGVRASGYFGDLTPLDDADADKEDAVERRLFLNIPSDAPAGIYTIDIDAFNGDSSTHITRKVVVLGTEDESRVVSATSSKTFAPGQTQDYTVTLVNTGETIKVYDLVAEQPEGLTVNLDETLVVVPAGSSKTVKVTAMSSKEGTYNFAVSVSSDGVPVKKTNFSAKVEGSKYVGGSNFNSTVLLTVVLAIIFVVLVVVLIVLLTRKPAKKEEFGESYY